MQCLCCKTTVHPPYMVGPDPVGVRCPRCLERYWICQNVPPPPRVVDAGEDNNGDNDNGEVEDPTFEWGPDWDEVEREIALGAQS